MGAFWLLSFLVFGLFGWMLFKAYRYTTLSVGAESPEFHRVTRSFPAWRYFTRTTPLWLGVMSILGMLIAWLALSMLFTDFGAAVVLMLVLGMLGFILIPVWKLEMQYWNLVRGVAVTFDPQTPFFEVEHAGQKVRLIPGDVARVEVHQAQGRLEHGYLLFFLHDGRVLRLPWLFFFLHEFLEKCFGSVPREVYRHRIPWVRPLPVSS